MIVATIHETGRPYLRAEAELFGEDTLYANNREEMRAALKERYGKMSRMTRKVYIDGPDGERITCGFTHSFWNQDLSSGYGPKWYQTDWITFVERDDKPCMV